MFFFGGGGYPLIQLFKWAIKKPEEVVSFENVFDLSEILTIGIYFASASK